MKKNKFEATEHEIQSGYFEWVRHMCSQNSLYENIFAIPNGAHLANGGRGFKRLWDEGFGVGVPDIFVAIPASGWHGLFIESKSVGGKLSHPQEEWFKRLTAAGFCCRVGNDIHELVKITTDYLFGGMRTNEKAN